MNEMKINTLNQILFLFLVLGLVGIAFLAGRMTAETQPPTSNIPKEAMESRSFSDIAESAAMMPPGTTQLKYCLHGTFAGNPFYGQVLFEWTNGEVRPIAENSWLNIRTAASSEEHKLPLKTIFSFPWATKIGLKTVMDFSKTIETSPGGRRPLEVRASVFTETADDPAHLRISSGEDRTKDGIYQITSTEEQCEYVTG